MGSRPRWPAGQRAAIAALLISLAAMTMGVAIRRREEAARRSPRPQSTTSSSSTRRTTASTTSMARWEGVRGPPHGRRGSHAAGEAGRNPVPVPAPGRREPHGAGSAERPVPGHEPDRRLDLPQPLLQRAADVERRQPVPDRRLHPGDREDLSGPEHASAPRTGSVTRMACAGGCTRDLVHRFYQEQYQLDGGKQDRYTTGSDALGPHAGLLRHAPAARLQVPASGATPALRDLRRVLPGGVRRLVPEPPVADRGADAVLHRRPDGRDRTTSTRSRTRTGCRSAIRSTRRRAPSGIGR